MFAHSNPGLEMRTRQKSGRASCTLESISGAARKPPSIKTCMLLRSFDKPSEAAPRISGKTQNLGHRARVFPSLKRCSCCPEVRGGVSVHHCQWTATGQFRPAILWELSTGVDTELWADARCNMLRALRLVDEDQRIMTTVKVIPM